VCACVHVLLGSSLTPRTTPACTHAHKRTQTHARTRTHAPAPAPAPARTARTPSPAALPPLQAAPLRGSFAPVKNTNQIKPTQQNSPNFTWKTDKKPFYKLFQVTRTLPNSWTLMDASDSDPGETRARATRERAPRERRSLIPDMSFGGQALTRPPMIDHPPGPSLPGSGRRVTS